MSGLEPFGCLDQRITPKYCAPNDSRPASVPKTTAIRKSLRNSLTAASMTEKACGVAGVVRCVMDLRETRETHTIEHGQPKHEDAECLPSHRHSSRGSARVSEDA